MERVPEEKRSGVEKRVEEVVHEHRELEKKVRSKEEVSACAVMKIKFKDSGIFCALFYIRGIKISLASFRSGRVIVCL